MKFFILFGVETKEKMYHAFRNHSWPSLCYSSSPLHFAFPAGFEVDLKFRKYSTQKYKNKPKATYTQTVIVQNEYSETELDTNESRNTTRCQSCNVWINLDGSFVDNPVVSGRTVIITFPKVIIPVTLVALFFLGSRFN